MAARTELPFEKLSATGNRFLFIQTPFFENGFTLASLRELAIHACAKHRVDGLVLWKFEDTQTRLLIVNSDGSLAGTCGNALRAHAFLLGKRNLWNGERCLRVLRYWNPAWLGELADDEAFASSDSAFAVLESVQVKNPVQGCATVDMGVLKQVLKPQRRREFELEVDSFLFGEKFDQAFVELANPHWFFVSRGFEKFDMEEFSRFGKAAQNQLRTLVSPALPLSNIGMCVPTARADHFLHTVYERGAGLTQCCGSGAVAAFVALHALDKIDPDLKTCHFEMPGGSVSVSRHKGGYSLSGNVNWEEEGILAL